MKNPRLLSAAIALGLAAALAVGVGTPANAAVAGSTSGPVTVLPSAVATGSGYTDAGKLGNSNAQAMAFLYKYATSPEVAEALRARQAGQALTPAQTQVIATRPNTSVAYPTGAATNLAKANVNTVGGALAIYSNFQLGGQIGAIGTNFVSSAFGIDTNGIVCGARANASELGSKALGFFSGQDCSAYGTPSEFVPNTDASGSATMNACNPSTGQCATYLGSNPIREDATVHCFNVSGLKFGDGSEVFYEAYYSRAGSVTKGQNGYGRAQSPDSIARFCGGNGNFFTVDDPDKAFVGMNLDTSKASTGAYTPVVTGSADPDRTLQCVILGSDGATYTKDSTAYRESAGLLPDVQCPDLPSGVIADTTKVLEKGGDRTNELWSTKTPTEVRDALVKYPGCAEALCLLELVKLGTSPLTTCHQTPAGCEDWFTDPQKTSKYACTYGGSQVALEECTTYANRWKPTTENDGKYLSDPKTGDVSPKPAGTPGGKSQASMDPTVEDERVSCLPDGFTLNPIDWVLAPLKCAFSPRQSVVTKSLAGLSEKADASMPGRFAATIGSWDFHTPASGCGGIPVNLFFTGPFTIMNACPGDTLAPVAHWSSIFGNVAIVVIGVMGSARYVGAAFGFTGLGGKSGDDE